MSSHSSENASSSTSSSAEESHGGFSTGTSDSEASERSSSDTTDGDVDVDQATRSQIDPTECKSVNEEGATSLGIETPFTSATNVDSSADHSVVRGDFDFDEDADDQEFLLPPSILGNPEQLDDVLSSLLSYQTPPRTGNPTNDRQDKKDDVEHEIVFEPTSGIVEDAALFSTDDNKTNTGEQLDRIKEESEEVGDIVNISDTTVVADSTDPCHVSNKRKPTRNVWSRVWRPSRRLLQPPPNNDVGDPTTIAHSEADCPTVPRHRSLSQILARPPRQSRTSSNHANRSSRTDRNDESSPNTIDLSPASGVSPAKTEPSSDVNDSPDRNLSIDQSQKRVLFAGLSPLKQGHHINTTPLTDREGLGDNDDDLSSRLGLALSVRTLCVASVALMLMLMLSTIGTSFLGSELALRGRTVSLTVKSEVAPPSPSPSVIGNPHNITNPPVPQPEIKAPPAVECNEGQVLLQFEIRFDSKPAEVGFSLQDSGLFGGASLWAFDALSFRSFTQFLRKNVFSICLSQDPTYEFEITDALANGLVSSFGSSTLVFGEWSLTYNSSVVAQYYGDCGTVRSGDNTTIHACGYYCRCNFSITAANATVGGCETNCTPRN